MSGGTRDRGGFTLIELLVVMAIISVLIALLLPGVQAAREAARRTQCVNNLMQLSIALKNYEAAHETLPSGVVNPTGPIKNQPKGYHYSWLVQLLPYLEENNVYRHFDFSVGVYDPKNMAPRKVVLNVFLCPSDGSTAVDDFAPNNYAGCHNDVEAPIDTNNRGVLFLNSRIRSEDVTDGTANTIFIGEKLREPGELGWASGTRATLRNTGAPINSGGKRWFARPAAPPVAASVTWVGGFSSAHHGGANFAFGDGSVRLVKETIDLKIYRYLGNRADGQMISQSDF